MTPRGLLSGARSRVRFLSLCLDATRRLGPAWIVFRIRYAAGLRLGHVRRSSPLRPWAQTGISTAMPVPVVDAVGLRNWLLEHTDEKRKARLRATVERVSAMEFNVFGQTSSIRHWHHDGVSNVVYRRDVHWSQVREADDADLKCVWEPSRFGWAFELVRAHHVLGDVDAAEAFWRAFESWRDQNPPNAGVNWICGQEASVRLMAVALAAQAMPDTVDQQRARWIHELATATGERVESNIRYARSQRNNHHASEAVGLITSAYLSGPGGVRDRWWALGELHLLEVAEQLIFADGGSSQYSTNYHRVFVHNLVWAVLMYRAVGREVPADMLGALRRATVFLAALGDPRSGYGWFFGADDGSRVLAVSDAPHRQLSDDVHLASAVAGIECGCGCDLRLVDSESLHWFGLGRPAATHRPGRPEVQSFADVGVHVLSCGATTVFVRCGSHTYRPSQDDQLHCDVWFEGKNIVLDSGTGSYRPTAHGLPMFDEVWDHNGPHLAGVPHSPKVGRFLRASWPTGTAIDIACDAASVEGTFVVKVNGNSFTRSVRVVDGEVRVTDRCDAKDEFVVRWKSADLVPTVLSEAESTARVRRVRDTYSRGYRSSESIDVTEVTASQEVLAIWSLA